MNDGDRDGWWGGRRVQKCNSDHRRWRDQRFFSCLLSSTLEPGGRAPSSLPVEPAVGLADGRRGLRLPELALAAGQTPVRDPASHHAGLDLLKVVRLRRDFGLQEADVSLIPSLLLGEQRGEEDTKHRSEIRAASPSNLRRSALTS